MISVRKTSDIKQKNSSVKHFVVFEIAFLYVRHEEDGVQDEAMAWEVLRLLHLQESHWWEETVTDQ